MFTREYLKGLELDSDIIGKIMSQYGKAMEKMEENNESLTTKLKETEDSLKEFKDLDVEKLKTEQFEAGKTEGSKEVETMKKDRALEEALKDSKAKDISILKKLLTMDSIEYEQDENGDFKIAKGLTEQIEKIKEKKDLSLFEEVEEPKKEKINLGGNHNNDSKKEPSTLVDALKEQYEK